MFQFHQEQIQLTPVICNKVKHQGENIRSLCLNPDCKMNSAVCSSCLNSDHQNCRIYVKDLQEIQIKLMELQALQLNVLNLQNSINEQFKELLSGIELLLKPLEVYKEMPTLTNLNGIGLMLRSHTKDMILKAIGQKRKMFLLLLDDLNDMKQMKQSNQVLQNDEELSRDGVELYYQKKYKEAEYYFTQAIEINPKYGDNWYNKGKALTEQQKYNEAVKCYNTAIQLNPGDSDYWYSKGVAVYHLKQYDQAIYCFNNAIQINQNNSDYYYMKGKTLYWKNEKFEANLCYNKAIEINRGDSNYWNWKGSICLVFLGTALFDLNRFDEAVKCYKEALNIQPNDAYTKSKLRAALNALQRNDQCILI